MDVKKVNEKPVKKTSREGIPMSEESYKEWQQVFIDIEESIDSLYKEEEK